MELEKTCNISLEELHQYLLEILHSFNDFCEELKINYYLAYGSLLGACRHSGFIPWDDDIDLYVLREDYERIIKYFSINKTYRNFSLKSLATSEEHYFVFSKFVMKDIPNNLKQIQKRLVLDIFPVDSISESKLKNVNKVIKKVLRYKKIISSMAAIENNKKESHIKLFLRKVLCYSYKNSSSHEIANELNDYCSSQTDKNGNYAICFGAITPDEFSIIPLDDYKSFDVLKFEDMMIKVPKNYRNLLESIYGPKWELPPKERLKEGHKDVF